MIALPPIVGVVTSVHDGDSFHLGSQPIRLRAIDANELHGACHTVCATHSAIEARDNLARLALGRTVTCEPTGHSYKRIVAWCSVDHIDLSCAQFQGGFAVHWLAYDRKNELCRRRVP